LVVGTAKGAIGGFRTHNRKAAQGLKTMELVLDVTNAQMRLAGLDEFENPQRLYDFLHHYNKVYLTRAQYDKYFNEGDFYFHDMRSLNNCTVYISIFMTEFSTI
tara:strand:- start:509 stop:820 length:312 start_codon:yes stop_codon:yes gene_type:complete